MDPEKVQLFVDDSAISSSVLVSRRIHQPVKYGPVLTPDRPWEGSSIVLYGTVLKEGDLFRIWYQTFNRFPPPKNTYICYAESSDGIHWERPDIGAVEYNGSRNNNIVLQPPGRAIDSPSVIVDPDDPDPSRRYKLLVYGRIGSESGLLAAFSPDGYRFEWHPGFVGPRIGDRTNLILDRSLDRPYVAYTRRHDMMRSYGRRVIYRSDSSDFISWSDPVPALVPDLGDSYDIQFYGMTAFRYGDAYLGLVQRLHTAEDRIDLELVTSRDNFNWDRTRSTFLDNGPEGSWDEKWVSPSSAAPIPYGDRLWIFHEGRNFAHGARFPFPKASIGLATLRMDGFASIDAGNGEGWVETVPFTWPGGELVVNVSAHGSPGMTDRINRCGEVRVEVLDGEGLPIKGFGRDDSEVFRDDEVAHVWRWRERSARELEGRRVSLRFYLVRSELYSFRAGG